MSGFFRRVPPFLAALTLVGLLVADLCGAGASGVENRPLPPDDRLDRAIAALTESDGPDAPKPQTVTFDLIGAFPCPWPEVGGMIDWRADLPADVAALHGQRIALAGWSIPLALDGDRVTQFVLAKHAPDCCFGIVPQANEMVTVRLAAGESIPYDAFAAVVAVGTLKIADAAADGGGLTGIYTLEAARADLVPTED